MKPEDEIRWRALLNHDPQYNGIFYYGVKSTGIFCRPSCKSKAPRRENVVYFQSPQEALGKGFRPCKRCRPDLNGPPENPAQEIGAQVVCLLQSAYQDPEILTKLPEKVGVSSFHLQRLFKKYTGSTPAAFLRRIRIDQARKLLEKNQLNNTEICFRVGFQSLSSFYAAFRNITGKPPGEYRLEFANSPAGGFLYEINV